MIESWIAWATPISIWAESIRSEGLTALFKFFAALGDTKGYMVIAPWVFWFVKARRGLTLFFTIMLTYLLMAVLKSYFAIPRPFVSGVVSGLENASSYSFPSGHAMIGMAFWLFLSLNFRKHWLWVWAACSILLIGLSRIYLGVHYASDVLVGWSLGMIVALGMMSQAQRIEALYDRKAVLLGLALVLFVASLSFTGDTQQALGYLAGGVFGIFLLRLYEFEEWQRKLSFNEQALHGIAGIALVFLSASLLGQAKKALFYGTFSTFALSLMIVWLVPKIFLRARAVRGS